VSDISTAERRRRPLTPDALERLRAAIDPTSRGASARPVVGGVDTATYALRLERDNGAREVVLRIYRDWRETHRPPSGASTTSSPPSLR